MSDPLDSMFGFTRRLPPTQIEENVLALMDICPDYVDDLGNIDQLLEVKTDIATEKEYLTYDHSGDGDNYRSPWFNEYDPSLDDGTVPSVKLRKLGIPANEAKKCTLPLRST
ncbi:F-actin capping protein, beta subunit [Thelephora ganbajun]|uniref:F-actin capping protein, beta subunit n=1 Tax=Thelephora ganbajun TaxID=370292 RepID=A0ACB6ZHB1_THEGA|nr:F-actin capping protein, beta subunit [Thelephora ganbajun]